MKYLSYSLFLLIGIACFSVNDAYCQTKTECVHQVLEEDAQLGSVRDHASEQMSMSAAIDEYTSEAKALDFTSCPGKFKKAFDKHIESWIAFKAVSDKYPAWRGEMHDLYDKLKESKDSASFRVLRADIFSTWDVVKTHSDSFFED